ncbi:hypothetical protein BGZ76_010518 [Entomortierella beljakovae]|nr:hypothetical protein BGZ76_010518 [Entomortierella beljakovae]
MSDFPALGSANNATSNPGLSSASYASTAGTLANSNSSVSGSNLSQEFSIEDDFPALPGARSNSSGSGRHFGSLQLHQQQQPSLQNSRSQQNLQLHPSPQQSQHLLQQSTLDSIGGFSSLVSPSSGSQMQQSMQLQQQLANDLLFQQQHQSLAQQQLLQLNGSHSPLGSHLSSASGELGKTTKSYATKAGNGTSLFLASGSGNGPVSSLASTLSSVSVVGGNSGIHLNSSHAQSNAGISVRQSDSSPDSILDIKPHNQSITDDHDRFGLYGMLGIRVADQDSNTLTLGRDLTTLGLSLNSAEPLYGTFASPWFEVPSSADVEAEFHVPACYNVQPPPPPQAKLSSVLDETLFYMFYSMPRDTLQDAAAVELYTRHWRYHKELRLWLMKDQSSEQVKTPNYEKGTYIFFDPNSWEKVKKDFIVMYDALEERRQVNSIPQNGSTGSNVHAGPSAANGGVGSMSHTNGLDAATHSGLLNSLNSTSTTGSATSQPPHMKQTNVVSNLMGSTLHAQNFQQQQQSQQQRSQQKPLQMMNMASGSHGFISSSKPQ